MDHIIFPPSSTSLQDCHLNHVYYGAVPADGCPIKQAQVAERILSLSIDNFPVPPASYLQGLNRSSSTFSTSHLPVSAQVELPLDSIAENEVLPIVSPSLDEDLIPVPRHQDLAWNGRHAQVNYFSRSPTMYGGENGRFPVLPHHTFHAPINHAHIPLESRFPDTPPVNAIAPFCNGVVRDRTFDSSAYGSFALPSLSASVLLPHSVGYPSGHLPAFTAIPSDLASHHEGMSRHDDTSSTDPDVSSWTVSPNPVVTPLQGPYPPGYLAGWNIPTPLEWAESSAWFRNQPYPPSYEQTEIVSAPVLPHVPPYIPQLSSQSNSNAVGNLHIAIDNGVSRTTLTVVDCDLCARCYPSNAHTTTSDRLSSYQIRGRLTRSKLGS
ncbi:hypothetical protein EV401DRAFT_2068477 [Pisolithus croceorrhizus]|nr:hypothetical protein EV401DRAFT_2068477 [Pisolithus croceorrhizus]